MNQKAFVIVFVVFLFFVTGGMLIGKYKTWDSLSASPSPTPDYGKQLFGASASDKPINLDDYYSKNSPQPNTQNNQFSDPNVLGEQKQTKSSYTQAPEPLPIEQLQNKKAVIVTKYGNIEIELYPNAPKASTNFIFLAGEHFYDGLTFHRVDDPGSPWVVQGGDPDGNGTGGPGYTFTEDFVSGTYDRGVVAMAKKGNEPPGTGGSQFFIMTSSRQLPQEYVIFGKVIKGMEVVDKIRVGDVMQRVSISNLN